MQLIMFLSTNYITMRSADCSKNFQVCDYIIKMDKVESCGKKIAHIVTPFPFSSCNR